MDTGNFTSSDGRNHAFIWGRSKVGSASTNPADDCLEAIAGARIEFALELGLERGLSLAFSLHVRSPSAAQKEARQR